MHPDITVRDWGAFARLAESLDPMEVRPSRSAYLFRGHADAEWSLIPSLLREAAGLTAEQVLDIESDALESFQRHAYQYLDFASLSRATDVVSWWTLMQHHGAPTRLLDWTASPYVAAYFAVEQDATRPGAVWLVHTHTMEGELQRIHGNLEFPRTAMAAEQLFKRLDAPPTIFFARRITETQRMAAQQTGFTVSPNILADHGAILAALPDPHDGQKEIFRKIIIPREVKREFLRRLRRMNVTASALFPGVDGLGRSVAELVRSTSTHVRETGAPRP